MLGIKLFGGTIILEYANGRGFAVFDVDMAVGKWQQMAISVMNKQATLYWNCEKSGTKTITNEFSFASYAKGIVHLGELGRGYNRYKMEVCARGGRGAPNFHLKCDTHILNYASKF